MDPRNLHFIVALILFSAVLASVAVYYLLRQRRTARSTWHDLLDELVLVSRKNIALIARDLTEDTAELEPSQIWTLIGGMDGLETLQKNCEVLIKLAFYLQQFYPEALPAAEQLRLNAKEIEFHISRLHGAAQVGKLQAVFPDYAQRAVATYYRMTQSVLALYQQWDQSHLAALESTL